MDYNVKLFNCNLTPFDVEVEAEDEEFHATNFDLSDRDSSDEE
jgi:hypothetical protein